MSQLHYDSIFQTPYMEFLKLVDGEWSSMQMGWPKNQQLAHGGSEFAGKVNVWAANRNRKHGLWLCATGAAANSTTKTRKCLARGLALSWACSQIARSAQAWAVAKLQAPSLNDEMQIAAQWADHPNQFDTALLNQQIIPNIEVSKCS